MKVLKYSVNSLIEWQEENGDKSIERLLWIDDEIAYVIDVNKIKFLIFVELKI